jgi:beta-glucosidase
MPWIDQAAAVLQAWYPGQEAGHAIADVLFGDVEPGGRLPQTFPTRIEDNPTYSQDPEIYPGLDGKVRYEEGLFTGHRHYDQTGIVPLFPFGHGMGYTTFELSELTATMADPEAEFRVMVTNTGPRRGSAVVQLYLGPDPVPAGRPRRQLRAFAKVTLDAGVVEAVVLRASERSFRRWDSDSHGCADITGSWIAEAGFSAADIRLRTTLTVPD